MFRNFNFFLYLLYSNKTMGYRKGEKITDEVEGRKERRNERKKEGRTERRKDG